MKKSQRTFSADLIIKFQKQQPRILFGNYYDAALARFVTADTVIDGEYSVSGWNRYMYCAGNPVLYTDPSGHSWQTMQQEFRKGILDSQDTDSRLQTEQKVFDLERTDANCIDSLRSKLHDVRVERGWSTDLSPVDKQVLDSYKENFYKDSIPWFVNQKNSNGPVKPVDHPNAYVSSGYYRNSAKWRPQLHGAGDISTRGVEGVEAVAAFNVTVLSVSFETNDEKTRGYGNLVKMRIDDPGDYKGHQLWYAHLADKPNWNKGDKISKGEVVGIVGGTGRMNPKPYPVHLHLEIRDSGGDKSTRHNINELLRSWYPNTEVRDEPAK